MIYAIEAPMGCGMTLASTHLAYQELLKGKSIVSKYRLSGKYFSLTREEFVKEVGKSLEGMNNLKG